LRLNSELERLKLIIDENIEVKKCNEEIFALKLAINGMTRDNEINEGEIKKRREMMMMMMIFLLMMIVDVIFYFFYFLGLILNLKDQVREEQEKFQESMLEFSQVRKKDEIKFKQILNENEGIKEMLKREMLKAEDTCRLLESQIRELPKPFEIEISHIRKRNAEMQNAIDKTPRRGIEPRSSA
jgi:hypothetical protein